MKKILLHAGHGKTGTSYIQAFLAGNKEKLAENNITYPHHSSIERSRAGLTTSGNIDLIDHFDEYISECVSVAESDNVLFSSEFLFRNVLHRRDKFARMCKHFDVAVILFIRDPFEHAISMYGQAVKRGRSTVSVDEYMSTYKTPWLVSDFIDIVTEAGACLVVRNYSNYRLCFLRTFLLAINLEERDFTMPPVQDINRSLSPSEIRVQIAFNRHFGAQASNFVSQPLVDSVPLSPKIALTTKRKTYDIFCEKMTDIVRVVNEKLPDGERYSLKAPAHFSDQASEQDEDSIYLSDRQMDVIASAVRAYIHDLETRNRRLETRNELLRSRLSTPYWRLRRLFKKLDELKGREFDCALSILYVFLTAT